MASSAITKFAHLQIPLEDVLEATENFHHDNIIGHGGFGPAYKGRLLRSGELIKISALRLDRRYGEGDVEFLTEISMLSDLKHTNIVSLIGFCDEKDEKVILTTYAPKGSLTGHLNSPNLTWAQRLKICVGAARALSYLHYEGQRDYGVIHLNINSFTILLDENWEAKLSGFKVCIKQLVNRMDQVFLTEPIGTIGYVDPSIEKTKGVTHKSDIYSFGVVLFEILCGKKAYDVKNETNKYLAGLVKYHYENKTMQDIIHPGLLNQMSPQSFVNYLELAYSCLNEERTQRPDMNNIVEELETTLDLQLRRENLQGNNFQHLKIPLSHVKLSTDNFSETYKIRVVPGYCSEYRAELDYFDKENPSSIIGKNKGERPTVVIRRLLYGNNNIEEKFLTELEILTSAKHHNIVSLLGFCEEGSERILVIENFSNGSLDDYLQGSKNTSILNWEKRLKICIDVAHALDYFHCEKVEQKMIINVNINSNSIGLDENWGAKIVGFPFSKIIGTKYHIDQYKMSDVGCFGVLLLEILSGRKDNDDSQEGLLAAYMTGQSLDMIKLEEMIDPTIKNEAEQMGLVFSGEPYKNSLSKFINIANKCVTKTQHMHPTMKVVLVELEKALSCIKEARRRRFDTGEAINKIMDMKKREEQEYKDQAVDKFEKSWNLRAYIRGMSLELFEISLSDILLATDNFSETYINPYPGECTLYRVKLNHFYYENPSFMPWMKHSNLVVIKRYPSTHNMYEVNKFLKEIRVLMAVNKIGTLLGLCVEDSEMILVLEDFSNGCLYNYFLDANHTSRNVLTWERRLKICIDVAQALNRLHYRMEGEKIIINRSINSYNIGLDENWGAKIIEFSNSVFIPPNQEDKATDIKWSDKVYYIDPENMMSGEFKRESDVYSFGVVLFEILCGRLAGDPIYLKESENGLGVVARQRLGKLDDMIDPVLKEETSENSFFLNRGPNKNSLETFINIAYQCVETEDQRPTIKSVVKELEKALLLQKNHKNNPIISLEVIKHATKNFHASNYIGSGGFGGVFKGSLQDGDRFKTIVAKRLDTKLGQGEKEFFTELQILLEYKHENVIGLVGYCDEKDEKVIVYEYAPKGSLDKYLEDASLTWMQRLNICINVASALDFIHGGVGKQAKVIHRDIKTANILLDDDWKAKLGDFGLSLISPITQETDHVIRHACGTRGYLDPLYYKSGILTIKSDIYSFGVVLFEILCGRSTFAIHQHEGHPVPNFIKNIFEEGKHEEVVFGPIKGQIEPNSLITFQKIAYKCLHPDREERPTSKEVLIHLKKALKYQDMSSIMTNFALLQLPLKDVVKATNNFHDDKIIGHGGFYTAYKGWLLRSGRLMEIAARRFDIKHEEEGLDFLTKVFPVLFNLKHTNLVSIVGFCYEKDEKIIVTTTYEAKGNVGQHLNNRNLTWTQRLRICVGVARALSYLHYDKERDYAIIHCNINSDTILLDENYEAKLSGFENSIKQLVQCKDQVCLSEHIGTMGYIDPAIEKTRGVTHKSDIYSFGVVLFEILCGRKAFVENESDRFLAPLAKSHYENKTLYDIIHPDLYSDQISPPSLFKYSNIAYSCLNEDRAHRPDVDYIVVELEKALELQLRCENLEKKLEHLKIPLTDILLATNNFSESCRIRLIDDYYTWYRAELNHFDKENPSSVEGKNKDEHPKGHNTVVIKRICPRNDMCGDELLREIETLTTLKHPGMVTLLGYCAEGSEMILVTENVSNGYLSRYLGNIYYEKRRVLTWEKRLKISIDVARALNYLHCEMEDQQVIINRDICSHNIGLDENWGAKIVEFGESVFLPPSQEDEALYLKGIGRPYHIDPEYEKTGKLKRESDVYSFGVVLFEILCGRRASDQIYKNESDKGLAHVARESFRTGTLEDMIDPIVKKEICERKDSLDTFIKIAYQCVAETQDQRPTMKVVVKELEKALFLQMSQTDGSTDSVYCWPCEFWKVNTTTLSGWLLQLLGQRPQEQMHTYDGGLEYTDFIR